MQRAFGIAPVGALAVYAALLLLDPFDEPGGTLASLEILGVVLVVGYLAEAVVAWPLFILLQKRGLASPFVCLVGGLTLGLLLAGIFDLPDLNLMRWRYYAAAGLAGSSSGAVFASVCFKRPNKRLQPAAADANMSRRG